LGTAPLFSTASTVAFDLTLSLNPTIRKESTEDISGIRTVVQGAFGRPGEADLVDALRRAGALVLSVVATLDHSIVGHVAFNPVTIHAQDSVSSALALAPVAVTPGFQRRGIGSALILWSLDECLRMGHRVVIVLGEAAYYGRFGFMPASPFGIKCPFPAPPEAFMVLELSPGISLPMPGHRSLPPGV
jgi:putative acetyltransferase